MIHTSTAADPTTTPPPGTKRSTYFYIAVALISLIGLADATYLTIEHITEQSVRCTIVAGCSEVLSSKYALVAGVPLAMIGATAYFSVFSLATLAAFGYRFAGKLLNVLVAFMLLVSLWLIYLQAFVIHSFCQYCLLSAAVTFVAAALLFLRWRNS
ncbi:MAG TPA: vitamin K epoxide reductase family protein [Pyrinomonadaceae bacterium]|jgi:uncharacterized membrane protein